MEGSAAPASSGPSSSSSASSGQASATATPTGAAGAASTSAPAGGSASATTAPEKATATPAWKPPPVKYRGVERELSPEAYHALVQKGFAADEVFRETAAERKKREAEDADWKDKAKVRDLLKRYGHDPDVLGREWVVERYGAEQLTPEQKRIKELEGEKAQREAAEAKAKQEAEEKAANESRAKQYEEMGQTYMKALSALPGAPEGPGAWPHLLRMVNYYENHPQEAGALAPEVLAEMAVEDMQAEQASAWGSLEPAPLVKVLSGVKPNGGPSVLEKALMGLASMERPALMQTLGAVKLPSGQTVAEAMVAHFVADYEERQRGGKPAPVATTPAPTSDRPRNGDGTFRSPRESRQDAMWSRFTGRRAG